MKLISSAVFTTLAVLSFNHNVLAMQEAQEQMIENDQERQPMLFDGPVLPTMDDQGAIEQALHQDARLVCKDCAGKLFKAANAVGCSILSVLGMALTDHACRLASHPRHGDLIDHIGCLNGAGPWICGICGCGFALYSLYELYDVYRQIRSIERRTTVRQGAKAKND